MKQLNFNDGGGPQNETLENEHNSWKNKAKKARNTTVREPILSELDLDSTKQGYILFKKLNSSRNKADFNMLYPEWFKVWLESGHWFERIDVPSDRYHWVMMKINEDENACKDPHFLRHTEP